ncbi:MAG TPA: SpoIIE family protein phosphatase, partial [Candidatus Omnitrophota bacterium]|nr:SpoIIE family protein phosphatase [Candidatus Omnitrophota bacterium]
ASLYLFTDGLTEAKWDKGHMLGAAGVEKLLARHAALPLPDRLEAVLADVARDGLALKDDLTMMVVEARA